MPRPVPWRGTSLRRPWGSSLKNEYKRLKGGPLARLREGDPGLVGHAATLSAQAHQAILFKPTLDHALALSQAVGAVGVCIGHSGTVIGILLDPARTEAGEAARRIAPRLQGLELLAVTRVVDGGVRDA